MKKILFVSPSNPKGKPFDWAHARSMLSRIDAGENVGGWKLKNEGDRAALNMPVPPPLPQTQSDDAANGPADQGSAEEPIPERNDPGGD